MCDASVTVSAKTASAAVPLPQFKHAVSLFCGRFVHLFSKNPASVGLGNVIVDSSVTVYWSKKVFDSLDPHLKCLCISIFKKF